MLYRYCTIFFLLLYFVAPVAAEMAITRIVEVKRGSGFTVFLEAGTNHGLVQGTKVTLLREGEKIVHPLSGQVLGVPQEPVGMAEVRSAEANRAVAVLIKTYSTPKVGDMAEYDKASAKAVAQVAKEPEVVAHVMERVRGLEKDIKSYRKSQKTLSAYPVFAQQVWDEMGAIKSYLVTIDERLIELEAQQGEDRNRLSQVLNGEYMAQEAKELTIRYSEDTDVRLQVAGKTLVISVERDSLHLERAGVGTMKPVIDLDPPVVESEEDDDSGWSMGVESDILGSPYIFGGGLALIAALTGIAMFVIKRRYDDVMGGLEEFDELPDGEDFDSEDFDDDDDFDDEEYKA